MGTQGIREAMAESVDTQVVTDPIGISVVNTEPKNESEPVKADDAEPEEESFADKADYKKALKEWTKKQAESELREQHKKEVDGYYADLRKQRAQKRELKGQIQALQAKAQTQEPEPRKPDIGQYSDPEKYANDMVEYDRKARMLESQRTMASEESKREEMNEIDSVWDHNVKASGITDIDQVVEHVAKTGMLNSLPVSVRQDMVTSVMGPHILRFLASNPELVDDIADSPNPRLEMKQLENMLVNSLRKVQSIAPAQQSQQLKPETISQTKYTPPTASKVATSSTGGTTKKLTNASSMEEYIRLRNAGRK